MKWEKPSEELMDILETKLKNVKCEKRKMFGQYAFFLNGNMFTGVFQARLFLRLSPESKKKIMEQYLQISHFEPRKGQVMKEYIEIPLKLVENEDIFSELLDSSINYASRLPSKKK